MSSADHTGSKMPSIFIHPCLLFAAGTSDMGSRAVFQMRLDSCSVWCILEEFLCTEAC
jgi:hypothetical protein